MLARRLWRRANIDQHWFNVLCLLDMFSKITSANVSIIFAKRLRIAYQPQSSTRAKTVYLYVITPNKQTTQTLKAPETWLQRWPGVVSWGEGYLLKNVCIYLLFSYHQNFTGRPQGCECHVTPHHQLSNGLPVWDDRARWLLPCTWFIWLVMFCYRYVKAWFRYI